MESDFLFLIQALSSNYIDLSAFSLIVSDIVPLPFKLCNVSFAFVTRSVNRVAHELAHFAGLD